MHYFNYKQEELYAEQVAISELAKQINTPFYIYSTQTLVRHANVLLDAFKNLDSLIAFSVKSNSNLSILKTLSKQGLGADIVSAGELYRAEKSGIPASKIVFSGVGKTDDELRIALEKNIYQINVESEGELNRLSKIAQSLNKTAPICIRVNPDIRAGGHTYIETGTLETKFGIAWKDAEQVCHRANQLSGIDFQGIDIHIGSQINSLSPFEKSAKKACELITRLRSQGLAVHRLDLGGGLGIPYINEHPPSPHDYAQALRNIVSDMNVKVILEPGRVISGNAGILVTKIIDLKHVGDHYFVIIDAGMNDFLRPVLYDAKHNIQIVKQASINMNASKQETENTTIYTFAGPICESSDILARKIALPNLQEGDLIAIMSTGAYGSVMSSEYNTRPLIPEILVNGEQWAITRKRPDYESMLALESFPDWLD